ncbi:MAG TPA: glycosyltransferase [Candidatus Binatia bacterium]|jgi:hypothetical protein|nr:glycosyltransferase [Candidatus Binatia bacterium]
MNRLRVLLTNQSLAERGGTELFLRDIATGLLDRGHAPVAFSPRLGEAAEDLRQCGVPVVDDLAHIGDPPDVIHGHHHLETMAALLHFPTVPALHFCHGWMAWLETPLVFPRVLRHVAVDEATRDRIVLEHGVAPERVRTLPNFVDLERFRPRPPLPASPRRALLMSNFANEHNYVPPVREACRRAGLAFDAIGSGVGNPCKRPETILGDYDLVFAVGRSALEALAVGAAVILVARPGVGPMVSDAALEALYAQNLGYRTLTAMWSVEALQAQIARYDPADAARVSQRIRALPGRDGAVDALLGWYHEVIDAHRAAPPDAGAEVAAVASYVLSLGPRLKALVTTEHERNMAYWESARAVEARDQAQADVRRVTAASDAAQVRLVDAVRRADAETVDRQHLEVALARTQRVIDEFERSLAGRVRTGLNRLPGYGATSRLLRSLWASR